MRIVVAFCLLISSTLWTAAPDKDDDIKAEIKKLQGTWEGYVVDGKGEKADRGPVHLRVAITDDKMSAIDLGNKDKDMGSGTFKLDPSKPTKEIDANGTVLPGKRERMYLGIYEIDGDTLKWCVDNRQKERPTEFRSASGSYLLILKRKK